MDELLRSTTELRPISLTQEFLVRMKRRVEYEAAHLFAGCPYVLLGRRAADHLHKIVRTDASCEGILHVIGT
jgi:hypothetical protein